MSGRDEEPSSASPGLDAGGEEQAVDRTATSTAIDSTILLDVLYEDPRYVVDSKSRLAAARAQGRLIISEVASAEIVRFFRKRYTAEDLAHAAFKDTLELLQIELVLGGEDVAFRAGGLWDSYRRAGGPRERMLPDFLIAAHAMLRADGRFLTRDDGFRRAHFAGLVLV